MYRKLAQDNEYHLSMWHYGVPKDMHIRYAGDLPDCVYREAVVMLDVN